MLNYINIMKLFLFLVQLPQVAEENRLNIKMPYTIAFKTDLYEELIFLEKLSHKNYQSSLY